MTTMGRNPCLNAFLRHEPGLRHGSVDGVDQQQHAIDHGEHALHFTAEIRVSGRNRRYDAVVAPGDRRILRQDGDAALALQIIRVHDPLLQILAGVQRSGLPQQLIDESGLAVIDVRDDGDVAKFLSHSEALRENRPL